MHEGVLADSGEYRSFDYVGVVTLYGIEAEMSRGVYRRLMAPAIGSFVNR
jgi:hypothetical protein